MNPSSFHLTDEPRRWHQAWPDAIAFLIGLGMAWQFEWRVADLVWVLWLSSLLVGYALILWSIFGLSRIVIAHVPANVTDRDTEKPTLSLSSLLILGAVALFMVAFFTVHFGGFHFVHSVFLNQFFPVHQGVEASGIIPAPGIYFEVFERYVWFLPLAFVAERATFVQIGASARAMGESRVDAIPGDKSKAVYRKKFGFLSIPYRGVVRMHVLIFFFAGAAAMNLDHFAIYAVVYAVYFFPWSLVHGQRDSA